MTRARDIADQAYISDDKIQTNIALLAFKTATNGSLAKYSLQDQVIDEYAHASDTSGVDDGPSNNHTLAGGAYSGATSTPTVKEFAATNASFTIAAESVFTKIIVVGAGGSGGSNLDTAASDCGSGGAGGGYIVGIDYTSPAGVTTVNATIGAGGAKTGTHGNVGETSSIVFGSDLTLTATGGAAGQEGGGSTTTGGAGSKSGTSSGATSTLALAGGAGGSSGSTGVAGSNGISGTLDSVTYQASGGGGGGGHGGVGADGGNGLAASYTGGGGGSGGDDAADPYTDGGTGYKTAGKGGYTDGTEDGQNATVDSVTVTGATGGTASSSDARTRSNAGGGAFSGGGGGGGGDGGITGTGNAGDGGQGYIRLEYNLLSVSALTLQSTDTEAEAQPDFADMVMLIEDFAGTATVGGGSPDIKGFISRDSGTTFTEGTLVDEGDWGTNKRILAFHDLDIDSASQPDGTAMCYKITTHNQAVGKQTKIHATSIGWR